MAWRAVARAPPRAVSGSLCLRVVEPRAHGGGCARGAAGGVVCLVSTDGGGGLRNTLYRTSTRSSRRMTPMRRLLYRLAVPLTIGLVRAWWRLARVVRVEGAAHLQEALARAPSLVPCYWHQ